MQVARAFAMLEVDNLSLSYGKHRALSEVNLNVESGSISVILGANGAGKSSLLKAIVGIHQPDADASIHFDGVNLREQKPFKLVELGIALVPEGRGGFEQLTVRENLLLGSNPKRARASEGENLAFVLEVFPKLEERMKQIVGTMSGGEQQMVAVARALMSAPKLLMLDEPSLGLAPIMAKSLFAALAKIKTHGISMLIVEQNVEATLKLADYGYLLEAGRIVGQGDSKKLRNDPNIKKAFLGAA